MAVHVQIEPINCMFHSVLGTMPPIRRSKRPYSSVPPLGRKTYPRSWGIRYVPDDPVPAPAPPAPVTDEDPPEVTIDEEEDNLETHQEPPVVEEDLAIDDEDEDELLFVDGVVDLEPEELPRERHPPAPEPVQPATVPVPSQHLQRFSIVGDLCVKFAGAMIGHDISEEGARALWKFMVDNHELLVQAREQYYGSLPSFSTL